MTPTFVYVNLLYPGEGVDFHQRVRNADHMHPIHDTLTSEHKQEKAHTSTLVNQEWFSAQIKLSVHDYLTRADNISQ